MNISAHKTYISFIRTNTQTILIGHCYSGTSRQNKPTSHSSNIPATPASTSSENPKRSAEQLHHNQETTTTFITSADKCNHKIGLAPEII